MKQLLPYLALYRRHSIRLLLGIVLAVVTLLASIGLLTLSGWFLAAASLAGFAGLYSFNYMLPAAGVRGAAIIRTAGRYFERLVSHDGTFRVLQHLRVTTFTRLLPLTPGRLYRFQQGDLLNRLVADVDTLDHLYLRVISPLVGALCVVLVVMVGLSWLDVPLALTLGLILLLTLLALPPLFYRLGYPVGVALTQQRSAWRSLLMRWLQGMAELRIYGIEPDYRQKLDKVEQQWQATQQQQSRLSASSQAGLLLISGLTVTLILWLSAGGVGSTLSPGAAIALFVFCCLAAFEALAPVANAFQYLGQVIASAERISEITQQQPGVRFAGDRQQSAQQVSLTLQQVSFSYENATFPALQQVSLQLRAGEKLALIGRTGSGKSTLLQLITRAWDPQQGEITLNDYPLASWQEHALRKMTTVVSQRVHLFSATLRDNLLLAAPGASDSQLVSALQQVGLEKLLADPQGLHAWLGDGGRQLSGGERRRLGIARALLHDGALWLLDEPTEGLDAHTEQQILHLLHQVTHDKSVIMVTHRLQGIENMDRIGVMDGGQLVELGSHEALMAKGGRYSDFQQRFTL
ncbi:cysteine/glutathione ABC transporter ATP-binding protein/permease CydC [Erwinia sp. OLTSP20]|uniref:heme ABC transporter ATP-binding protein/permease CydC n=1 Tax=unclassified Erwinia TaxID=2622719 RepID=UPI000C189517|nr:MULTISPECIES: cysteine/glutathione ABC transporter ATP-binding protein/permease CydC [unclassified Erwinia]PIJ51301.1 cysteine/glutathione ABC transporter ATP-binding protein/permease CydC [Erwinia sp. OAMSP11]PIJ74086.1 cysteine/glutathione ABC transporter ATP-binding protein/permease CydC [Erwinia sp. OLSSP12]PIJ81192.1 cysteine/glutathione ABC transporter ATP-binding protein/permease CydC [Erwinia sp. OLCASP19]PIJ86049.1 cysteine/glutathione ABC transporter ATP-binding protein/permease Cy